MKFKVALVGICVLCLAGAVQAQKSDGVWTGPYLGVNMGGLLGSYTATEYNGPWDYGEYSITASAVTLGAQAGYNWKVGATGIIGLEADINWTSFDENRKFGGDDYNFINSVKWNWYSTFRSRFGLALCNTLVYATGGAAVVDVDYAFGDTDNPNDFISSSGTQWGYALGAGVEFYIFQNISFRGEYLYIGLPSEQINDFGGDTGDFVSSAHIGRAGLNYRF